MTYVTKHMREAFDGFRLRLVVSSNDDDGTAYYTEYYPAYYLESPHTRMGSTLIVFTPEGIALMGDRTPERRASVSKYSYGLTQFAGPLNESNLCEKFLERKWVQELAEQELLDPRGIWREGRTPEQLADLDDVCDSLYEHGSEWLYDELERLGYQDVADSSPGFGYNPREAGWLCAIQQKFSELYHSASQEGERDNEQIPEWPGGGHPVVAGPCADVLARDDDRRRPNRCAGPARRRAATG